MAKRILTLSNLHAPLRDALVGPIGTESGAAILVYVVVFGLVSLS